MIKRGNWKSTRNRGLKRKMTELNRVFSMAMFDYLRVPLNLRFDHVAFCSIASTIKMPFAWACAAFFRHTLIASNCYVASSMDLGLGKYPNKSNLPVDIHVPETIVNVGGDLDRFGTIECHV